MEMYWKESSTNEILKIDDEDMIVVVSEEIVQDVMCVCVYVV